MLFIFDKQESFRRNNTNIFFNSDKQRSLRRNNTKFLFLINKSHLEEIILFFVSDV